MNKIFIFVLIAAIIVISYQRLTSASNQNITLNTQNPEIVIYWGDGCPHCEIVKKHIVDNGIDKKIGINLKEVYNNVANQKELENVVKKCPEIDTSKGIGVPLAFVVKDNKCLLGDQPINNYLDQRTSAGK
jgi:glutaredoxin